MKKFIFLRLFGWVFFSFLLIFSVNSKSFAKLPDFSQKKVLVYNGPGSCKEGCAKNIAAVARRMGMQVYYLDNPKKLNITLLRQFHIYVQPGGNAIVLSKVFTAAQRDAIKKFIANGGRYLGICAGAFFADSTVDDAGTLNGLNILPGETFDLIPNPGPHILNVQWRNATRYIYYEEGAGFKVLPNAPVNIIATYNGVPVTIQYPFYKGKVALSGIHPEAPRSWSEKEGIPDPDGSDVILAAEMFAWLVM